MFVIIKIKLDQDLSSGKSRSIKYTREYFCVPTAAAAVELSQSFEVVCSHNCQPELVHQKRAVEMSRFTNNLCA